MNAEQARLIGLPPSERLELIEALWDSLGDSLNELPIPEWQKEELERRRQEHLRNPNSAIPWDEAKKRIMNGRG